MSIGSSYPFFFFFLSLSQEANPQVSGRFQIDFNRDKISHAVRETAEISKGQRGLRDPAGCREVRGGRGQGCALSGERVGNSQDCVLQ